MSESLCDFEDQSCPEHLGKYSCEEIQGYLREC